MPHFRYTALYMTGAWIWLALIFYSASPWQFHYSPWNYEITQTALLIFQFVMTFFVVWFALERPGQPHGGNGETGGKRFLLPVCLALLAAGPSAYLALAWPQYGWVNSLTGQLAAFPLIVLLLSVWRLLGLPLAIVLSLFSAYLAFGHLLPSDYAHCGFNLATGLLHANSSLSLDLAAAMAIPAAVLGALVDSLGQNNRVLGPVFRRMGLRPAPKFFIRHFWSWVLVSLVLVRLTLGAASYPSTLSEGLTAMAWAWGPLALIWSLPLLLFWALARSSSSSSPAILQKLGAAGSYLVLLIAGKSAALPSGLTFAAWAWRNRHQASVTNQPAAIVPLRHLLSIILIYGTVFTLSALSLVIGWSLSSVLPNSLWPFYFLPFLLMIGATFINAQAAKKRWGIYTAACAVLVYALMSDAFRLSPGLSVEITFISVLPLALICPGSFRFRKRRFYKRLAKVFAMRFPQMASLIILNALSFDLIINVTASTGVGFILTEIFQGS